MGSMPLVQRSSTGAQYVVISPEDGIDPDRTLTPAEQLRHVSLDPAAANDFCRGRYALKLLLAQHISKPLHEISIGADAFGKPIVAGRPDLFCSISHSRGYAAAAMSSRTSVGIDVEFIRPRHPALLRHISNDFEQDQPHSNLTIEEFTTLLWSCKEAAAKADSQIHDLAAYEISIGHMQARRGNRQWKLEAMYMDTHLGVVGVAA